MRKITIIGGGNGGQAMAGYFGMHEDYQVRIFDYFEETINMLKEKGGVKTETKSKSLCT